MFEARGWSYGVDFSGDAERIIAVRSGDGEIKYGLSWIGPILATSENMKLLIEWCEATLGLEGGYIHLFPADGDAMVELSQQVMGFKEVLWDSNEDSHS